MKFKFLGFLALVTAMPTLAKADCRIGNSSVDFSNFHQEGAARVASIRVNEDSYIAYKDVYNLTTLTLVENNQIVVSSSGLSQPVELKYEFHGTPIFCRVDQ